MDPKNFAGPTFHTADQFHEFADFSGQRVGVICTGSSGVQVIPMIARQARELTVFQRTAAYVVPAHNGPRDAAFEERIKSDYRGFRERNRRMRVGFGSELPANMVSALAVSVEERDARFEERWQIGGLRRFSVPSTTSVVDERAKRICCRVCVRGKIRATVHDPETALRFSPRQTIGCKRLCVDSSGYYETFNQLHVRLVDVNDQPIERITPRRRCGLRVREYALDVLVLATGFDAVTGTLMRLALKARGGLPIQDKWRAGPLNYLGLTTAGFPNLFNVAGAGSTSAFTSVIVSIEHHIDWISDCIAWLDAHDLKTIEATKEAEAAWMEYVQVMARQTVLLTCNSWYLGANIPGKARLFMPLTGGFPAYAERCAQVAAGGYEGFRLA